MWRYALPLLLGNWLQLAYNAVDSIIAGRFIGQNALAAEGIAGPVMNLVILAISGLCIGAGVLMSEYFGARKYGRLKQAMATMLLFGGAVCLAVAAIGFALAPLILRFLKVPQEIFEITVVYLRITFLGAPATFIYNAIAAGMKSVGDSIPYVLGTPQCRAGPGLSGTFGLRDRLQRSDDCGGGGVFRSARRLLHGGKGPGPESLCGR